MKASPEITPVPPTDVPLTAEAPRHPFKQNCGAVGFLLAKGLARILPATIRYSLARKLGRATGRLFQERRRDVQANLKRLLGPDVPNLEEKTDELFENFALTLCDFMNPRDVRYDVEGFEDLQQAVAPNEGVLFITFHLGHWDLGARILCEKGWTLTAIYQSYASAFLQKVVQAGRPEALHYLSVGQGAAFGAMSALARGEGVAVIGDKAFGEPGEPIPFLNGTTLWPKGPYVMGARAASWVVPGLVVRVAPGRYKGLLEKPIRVPRGPAGQVATDLSKRVAECFAGYLRSYPTQWYRFERFWIEDQQI